MVTEEAGVNEWLSSDSDILIFQYSTTIRKYLVQLATNYRKTDTFLLINIFFITFRYFGRWREDNFTCRKRKWIRVNGM